MKRSKSRDMVVLLGLGLLLAVVPLASGCTGGAPAPTGAASPAPAPAKVYELKFATGLPAQHFQVKESIEPWCEIVNRESKGRINAKVYPGGVLGEHAAAYEMVTRGTVESAQGMMYYNADVFPLTDVMNTPFSAPNSVIGTSLINGAMFDKYFAKEFAKVKIIALTMTDPTEIWTTKKPVRRVEDLKGMRIRVSGGSRIDMFKDFGAVPTSIATPEQYEALQKGVIDGTDFPGAASVTYKFWEVCKYVTMIDFSGSAGFFLMNKEFWDSLPRDLQLVIDGANSFLPKQSGLMYSSRSSGAFDRAKQGGMEIITLTPEAKKGFRDAAQASIDIWIQSLEKKGLPGRQLYADLMAQPELYGYR